MSIYIRYILILAGKINSGANKIKPLPEVNPIMLFLPGSLRNFNLLYYYRKLKKLLWIKDFKSLHVINVLPEKTDYFNGNL